MSANKALVSAFFKDISAKGMLEAFQDHGAVNFSWWICGMGDVTQQLPLLSAAFKKIFDERGMVINPVHIISEGDYVTVESLTDCRLRNGDGYRNTISHWITLAGSKIVGVREYFDSAYGEKVIGAALRQAFAEMH